MTTDRNSNLPRGPKADALGTLLYHLYKDVIDGEVQYVRTVGEIEIVAFGNWRGLHSVSITRGLNHSLWVVFSDGSECVSASVGIAPEWVADRIRMIWTECQPQNPRSMLAQLDEG